MTIEVVDPGPLTTIQDLGRRGWAHLGVPRAGAADRASAARANRLVGNDVGAALLETTMGGVTFVTRGAVTIAVTGAHCDVMADGRHVHWGKPVTVPAGRRVRVGPAHAGVRSYVAVRGGIDVQPVLGSRSTDTLSWVGPPRVVAGTALRAGTATGRPAAVDVVVPPDLAGPAILRVWRGARADWLAPEQWDALDGAEAKVGPDSDRIGLRLQGVELRRREGEVPTEGIVLGAVQVPPSGEPVVFLADHPTTGGYPLVGVVDDRDLNRCAQLRPGETMRLRVMG